jgi:hypothetical protein
MKRFAESEKGCRSHGEEISEKEKKQAPLPDNTRNRTDKTTQSLTRQAQAGMHGARLSVWDR